MANGRPLRRLLLPAVAVATCLSAPPLPLPIRVATHVAYADARAAMTLPDPRGYPAAAAGLLDASGYPTRQCTSFVAWALNSSGRPFAVVTVGPAGPGLFTNAATWDRGARQAGYVVATRPQVGTVAQWRGGETIERLLPDGTWEISIAGHVGHVALVTAVHADGTVSWEDYNSGGRHRLAVARGRAPRYLYIGMPAPR